MMTPSLFLLSLMLAGPCLAQFPGGGISKSTYACNDPIAGFNFLYKYFPVATPGDECDNNICTCPAGTGGSEEWYIQQGRVYTKMTSNTYDPSHLGPPAGNGFGLHLVNVSNHLTTGGMTTAEVEAQFNQKLGDMSSFDGFMDYNVMFYTSDLDGYISTFKKDDVPTYTTNWKYNGTTWTSVFVHVPSTQLILEICAKSSASVEEEGAANWHATPRASPRAIKLAEEKGDVGSLLWPLSVNRATSKKVFSKLDDFYVTGMGTSKTTDETSDDVSRKCYLWPGASVDICFYNRAADTTKGTFKVADFEDMLNTVHKNIIVGHPLCGTDKWADNHYAIDSQTADTSKILSYVEKNNVPHVCESMPPGAKTATLHYAFDPTGWGIQMDLGFSSAPSDCSSAAVVKRKLFTAADKLQGTGNPACSPGTCA